MFTHTQNILKHVLHTFQEVNILVKFGVFEALFEARISGLNGGEH